MCANDLIGNEQTQTKAGIGPVINRRLRRITSHWIEDERQDLFRYHGATIVNAEQQLVCGDFQRDCNGLATIAVLHGVIDQIGKHLLQPIAGVPAFARFIQ